MTPSNPSWSTNQIQGVSSQIQGLTGTDPLNYVANWNPIQQAAADQTSQLVGNNKFTNQAFDIANLVGNYKTPQVSYTSLLDNLDAYMNPYLEDVVNASLASYDKQAGTTRAQAQADMAKADAFNSSRAGIGYSELLGNLDLGRNLQESSLRTDAFNTGAQLSAQDKAKMLEASMAQAEMNLAKQNQGLSIASLLAGMGANQDANERADIQSILDVGNTLYDVENARARAPLDVTSALASMTGSMPYNLFTGQTTTSKSSPSALQTLGTIALGAGSLMSGGTLGALGGLTGLGGNLSTASKLAGLTNLVKG